MNTSLKLDKKDINHKLKDKAIKNLNLSLVNNSSLKSYFEPLIQPFAPKWSTSLFRAKVTKVSRLTNNVISIRLKTSKQWTGFKPGQYIELTTEIEGAAVTRCFSISSSKDVWKSKRRIELTIREQDQGRVTPWLISGIKEKTYVQISKAQGEFTLGNAPANKLFIAAGTGITPIISMLSSKVVRSDIKNIDLIYFARSEHIFKDRLVSLANLRKKQNLPPINLHFIDTNEDGRISLNLLKNACSDFQDREAYLCGPGGMINETRDLLESQGVSQHQIHHEYFGPTQNHKMLETLSKANVEPREVAFHSKQSTTQVTSNSNATLLELAETAELNPSYGCRMGVCHQCKCTKKSGVVINSLTGRPSDTGEEEIQMCISIPAGNVQIEI